MIKKAAAVQGAPQVSNPAKTKIQPSVQETVTEVKRSTTPLKRRRRSSLSITSHLEEKKKSEDDKVIDYSNMPKDDFTLEQMLKYWYEYAESLNKQGDQLLYSAMKREDPILNKNTIVCSLLNNTLATRFESESIKLLQYLREKLNNYSIKIETPITKLEEVKQVYTSRDRYDFILNKNALLQDFVTKLKLDLA
jgi:DNA polymerase-3 subunit gamma/tau